MSVDKPKLTLLWHSVVPWVRSGYGHVTNMILSRLVKHGYRCIMSAYYGIEPGGIINYNGITTVPSKEGPFGIFSAQKHAQRFNTDIQFLFCYDEDTEILTKEGWKPGIELEMSDELVTLNPITEELEYHKPEYIHISMYKGPMYYLNNRYIEVMVTPHHKMYIKKRNHKNFELVEVEDIVGKRVEFQKGAKWSGSKPNSFNIEGVDYESKDFLRLLGYYVSEGCTKGNQFSLFQKDGKVKEKMKLLLDKMNLKYKEYPMFVLVYSKNLAKFFKSLGRTAIDKQIPSFILDLSSEYLKYLWETLIEGDGWITKTKSEIYCSSSKKLIDQIQELLLKMGYAGDIRINSKPGLRKFPSGEYYCANTNWSITKLKKLTPRTIPYMKQKKRWTYEEKWVNYEGLIWCPIVPNHIVYIRRNGKVSFQGQTDWWAFSKFPEIMKFPCAYCYDEQTEILTNNGWKLFKDLEDDEEVAVLNNETLEFEKPKGYFASYYKGPMYKLKTKFLDMLVTPNHNLYVKEKMQNKYKLKQAKELIGIYKTFKKYAKWKGKEEKYFLLPEYKGKASIRHSRKILMNAWLEFMGYYLSEGNYGDYRVVITQSRSSPYFEDMIESCRKIGYEPKVYGDKSITIFDIQLVNYFRNKFPENSAKTKYIPKEFKNLYSKQLKILLNALRKGDGDKARPRYATKSKQLADDMQEISIRAGYATDVYYNRTGNDYRFTFSKKFREVRDRHRSKNPGLGVNSREELVSYDGMIYCVETNPKVLLVRRNGKEYFCGNSPMDHVNYPEEIINFTKKYRVLVALCKFQQEELKKRWGIDSYMIYHGVETNKFKPLDKLQCKRRVNCEGKFVFGTVAANCFDRETEVLTKRGWKKYFELGKDDKFVTLNKAGEIEYQEPKRIIIQTDYNGVMYRLKTKYLDIMVTPNHKLLVKRKMTLRKDRHNEMKLRRKIGKSYFFTEYYPEYVVDGYGKPRWFKKNGKWIIANKDIEFRGGFKMEDFLEILGYYIAEGNIQNNNLIIINQRKEHPRKKMIECVKRMGLDYSLYEDKIAIRDPELFEELHWLGKASEKHIPDWVLQLSKRYLTILWDALVLGDGWKTQSSEAYSTTSRKLAGQVQELLLKMGYAGDICLKESKNPKWKDCYVIHKNVVVLEVQKRCTATVKKKLFTEEWIPYEGLVWCVEVPNHTVYTRRNGKVVWSCQSDKEDRKSHAPSMKAMRYFLDQNPDIERDVVWIYHSNPRDPRGMPLSNICHKFKLDNVIKFMDPNMSTLMLSAEDLVILMNAFDVHILNSKREGFGLPIIETQSCGVPNMCHNFSSMPELVKGHGWLVKSIGTGLNLTTTPINAETASPDVYDIANKLERAFFRDKEREKYAKASREFALKFDWDKIVTEGWIPVLEDIQEMIRPKSLEERRLL